MPFTREQTDAQEHSRLIKAGLERAKNRGVTFGRPKALKYPQRELIRQSMAERGLTLAQAAELFNISKSTVYRILKEAS